jgi:hypothetical protein
VAALGDDTIHHAVFNANRQQTGAIHVYGGDFVATSRANGTQRRWKSSLTAMRESSLSSLPQLWKQRPTDQSICAGPGRSDSGRASQLAEASLLPAYPRITDRDVLGHIHGRSGAY